MSFRTAKSLMGFILLGLVLIWALRGKVGIDKRDEHGMTALMRAARAGDLEAAGRLVSKGADVNAKVPTRDLRELIAFISWMQQLPESDIGYTPLLYAAGSGHAEVARLLIEKGARVDEGARGGERPLTAAVSRSDLAMIRLLFDSGARILGRDLTLAVLHSRPEVVRLLLDRGADPDGTEPVTTNPKWPGPKPKAAIILAAQRGDAEIVKALLDRGADPGAADENGWTALRWAAKSKHAEVVRLLEGSGVKNTFAADDDLLRAAQEGNAALAAAALERGANANTRDNSGLTPLLLAAQTGNLGIVDRLLAAGARPGQATEHRATPLIAAARQGHAEVVRRLIAAGADVRHSDRISKTALYAAVGHRKLEAARVLLDGGADPNDGSLPVAALGGSMDLVQLLLERGAKPQAHGAHLLNEAGRGGHDDIILLLLEGGAEPNGKDGDMGPLHYAAANCGPAVVRAMVSRGARVDARDINGNTALVFAAVGGKVDNVKVLIAAGADVNAKDDDGKTVLDHATRFPELQQALREAGARS